MQKMQTLSELDLIWLAKQKQKIASKRERKEFIIRIIYNAHKCFHLKTHNFVVRIIPCAHMADTRASPNHF